MIDPAITASRRKLQWRHRLRWVRPTLSAARATLVGVASLLVFAMEIPWLQPPLRKLGLEDLSSFGVAVIVFILALVFIDVRKLASRRLETAEQYFSGPVPMFPVLLDRVHQIKRNEDKVIDILGVTLADAGPMLRVWLGDPSSPGWRIRVCAMVDRSGRFSDVIPADWADKTERNLNDALSINHPRSPVGRGAAVEVYAYDFLPGVHGCRLGNGDLFFSVTSWGPDDYLDIDAHGYHFLPCHDRSASATAMRATFDLWFRRACRQPWSGDVPAPNIVRLAPSSETGTEERIARTDSGTAEPADGTMHNLG